MKKKAQEFDSQFKANNVLLADEYKKMVAAKDKTFKSLAELTVNFDFC